MHDKDMIRKLKTNGLSKVIATVLVELKNADMESGLTTRQLVVNTGLHQPAVSWATIQAYQRGWLAVDYDKSGKGGRTVCVYKLSKPFSEIVHEVADARAQTIAGMMNDLNALRAAV